MPKRYRKLRGDTAYYPFAARTGLRARQRRHVRVLRDYLARRGCTVRKGV